jgi:hypothetical protein
MQRTMTEAEYRAHPALSQSDLKAMLECPAAWLAKHRREESEAMLVGKLFEAEVCEDATALAELKADERLYRKDGALRAAFADVANMVARWRRVEPWQDIAQAEQQPKWFAVLNGVEIKGKPDLWYPGSGVIEDIKTTADMADKWQEADECPWWPVRGRVPWWQAMRYDLQAAMYLTLSRLNDIEPTGYRLRVVTKQTPPDVDWLDLMRTEGGQRVMAPVVQAAKEYLPALLDEAMVLRSGGKSPRACFRCEYCRENKQIHRPVRAW